MEPMLVSRTFLTIQGKLTVIGRQPDGDSIHFIPTNPKTLLRLPHATRLKPAKDGGVQLRIDGIDAPETHFLGQSQPFGIEARKAFLREVGFSSVDFNTSGTVVASEPKEVPATIFTALLDLYGRPVSYVLPGVSAAHPDGAALSNLDEALLQQTANLHMLDHGNAYATAYSSTPAAQRAVLFAAARKAHDKRLGVWAIDDTKHFSIASHIALGPTGKNLILPKVFRRATSYLDAVAAGHKENFANWLISTQQDQFHSQDDLVVRADGSVVRLHTLIHETGTEVTTTLDVLSDVFIEQ